MNQFVTRGLLPALSLLLAGIALGADAPPAAATKTAAPAASPAGAAKTDTTDADQEKTLYALGVLLSHNLDSFSLSEAEFAHVRTGFIDGYHHKPTAANAEASLPQIQALQRTRAQVTAAHEKEAGQAYLTKAASAPGANKTATGMLFIPVAAGSGPSPTRSDRVKVNYEGRLIDGTVFDSSAQHGGQPALLSVAGIIPCWTEALQLMKVGGKSRIVCPSGLAYGDRGAPPKIKPGATLEFDIELVSIEPPAPAPTPGAGTLPQLPGPSSAPAPAAPKPQ
jgi:FKBP-type peptidyl-prolyl cis-trans isomerase FkpA/FKBP-type peptidyl-prolyl cis-trans isomerase FklB